MPKCAAQKILTAIAIAYLTGRTLAQPENPVYVDDSPAAWELFRQAQDQSRSNAGEAVRLYQELLEEFGLKLIPVSEAARDHFTTVRRRVLQTLAGNPALLERYRFIQTPHAERLLQANELDHLAATRSLTLPGLEALLRLAQGDLEAARFRTALSWLNQTLAHPDLTGRRAAHCWFMIGMASHYLGEVEQLNDSLAALEQFGAEGQGFHAQLARLAADSQGPSIEPARSTLDRGDGSDLDDLVAQAIWTVPLQDSLLRRRFAEIPDDQRDAPPTGLEQRLLDADFTTAVPTVSGSTVYINQGYTVLALNRLTGRQLWPYSDIGRLGLPGRESQNALDMNVVAVSNDAVVTLTGHAMPTGRSDDGQVLCLDAATGAKRWAQDLKGLSDGGLEEDLFPHGAPLIAEGMVFVAARKVSRQLLTSMYVVGIDLDSGEPRWWRHITSSGGLQARTRPFCTLLHDRGSLYVSSAVGAAARIEPGTGEIRWLQRFNVPITPGVIDQTRRPWEITGPVMTPRGFVAVQPDQRRVILLDPDTGNQLESHNAAANADWNLPRYLLADDQYVYGIGNEIRAFDHDDLANPIWRLPPPVQENVEGEPTAPSSIEIRGRVQVVEGSLIVPSAEGIMVVDRETGKLRNTLPVQPVGNPLAAEAQLLLACGDRLDSYMSFNKAQQMLRDRIVQAPDEPEPALSLLRLGMRVRNLALSLEAADLAMQAINRLTNGDGRRGDRATEARDELFSLLLDLAAARVAVSVSDGEPLYATIGAVAVEPAQRVEYLLSYGQWLTGHSLAKSVESYQSILSDRTLATSWRVADDSRRGDRPASAWATERLAELIEQRGLAIYAPQADYAALRLRQIMGGVGTREQGSGNRDQLIPNRSSLIPDQLVSLAMEFPFSAAAIDAVLAGADLYLKRGQPRAALGAINNLYQAVSGQRSAVSGQGGVGIREQGSGNRAQLIPNRSSLIPDQLADSRKLIADRSVSRLLGAFIRIAEENRWTTQARTALSHVIEVHGDLPLADGRRGDERKASTWLAALEAQSHDQRHTPRIGEVAAATEAIRIDGSVIRAHPLAATAMPSDRVLLRQGQQFQLFQADKLQMGGSVWTSTVQGEAPQMLRFDDRGVLIWLGADPQNIRAVMLDHSDGKIRWTTPRTTTILGEVAVAGATRRFRGGNDQMVAAADPFDPTQTLPVATADSLFMIQRNGGVMAIELADPAKAGKVRWSKKQILDQVHLAAASDSALVLAGTVREAPQGSNDAAGPIVPRILVLDPMTGQPLVSDSMLQVASTTRSGIRWMTISPLGLLVYGTAEGVDAIDLYTGERRWTCLSYAVGNSQRAWQLAAGDLIFEDQRSRLRSINLADGSISEPFETPLRGEWEPPALLDVLQLNGDIVAHYPQRVVMYEPKSGAVAGVDFISDPRDYRWLLPAQDANGQSQLLVINTSAAQVPAANGPGMRSQYLYRLYLLSNNGKVLGEPLAVPPLGDKVEHARLIDGWLLLSMQSGTLAVPMPPK